MRKFPFVILIAVSASLGAMIFFHRQSMVQHETRQARIEMMQQRQGVLREMSVSLEKYRRMSANFRKMTEIEMDQSKDVLKRSIKAGLARMEQLDPVPEEIGSMERIKRDLDGMMDFAAKFERTAFNKDAYQKSEMVAWHDGVEAALRGLGANTERRLDQQNIESADTRDRVLPILFALAGVIVLLIVAYGASVYWMHERPLRKLHLHADEARKGTLDIAKIKTLSGLYGDILSSLAQLGQMVQGHARERHKFILDVVSDLRAPLTMLTEGKHLIGGSKAQSQREMDAEAYEELKAMDSVRRGMAMLAGSLEDFDDLVEISRLDSKMEENLVDLSEVISDVSRHLNAGPGMEKQISATVPPMPIWMRVDARRVERVLIQVIAKVASTLHRGTGIHIGVSQPTQGSFRGVEILVQDVDRARDQPAGLMGSGPDLDVLRHWISEKGLGLTLSHRVVKALGGTLTASGVAGSSVQISIRLPQERLAQVGLISAPVGLEVNYGKILRKVGSQDDESSANARV